MSREDKKQKFTQPQKKSPVIWIALAAVVLIAVGGWFMYSKMSTPEATSVTGQKIEYFKADPVTYQAQVNMTDVEPKVEGDKLVLSLADVKKGGIIYTKYTGKKTVPITSFLAPSGKLVVAVSMCEPCSGERFWIDGSTNQLVCSACGTRWTLEDLQGVSGGCPQYPPDQLNYQVKGDKILINTADIESWKNRITGQ